MVSIEQDLLVDVRGELAEQKGESGVVDVAIVVVGLQENAQVSFLVEIWVKGLKCCLRIVGPVPVTVTVLAVAGDPLLI